MEHYCILNIIIRLWQVDKYNLLIFLFRYCHKSCISYSEHHVISTVFFLCPNKYCVFPMPKLRLTRASLNSNIYSGLFLIILFIHFPIPESNEIGLYQFGSVSGLYFFNVGYIIDFFHVIGMLPLLPNHVKMLQKFAPANLREILHEHIMKKTLVHFYSFLLNICQFCASK